MKPVAIATEQGSYDFYTENLAECIKATYKFTETVHHNICTGEVYTVPVGFWDLCFGLLTVGIGLTILVALARAVYMG